MAQSTRIGGAPRVDRAEVLAIPVWRIRLNLMWRGLRANAALFAENPIGLVGLGIILFFALMALAHPILMSTVWDKGTYDPVLGIDLAIPLHPTAPSATHLLGTDPLGRDILSQLMWSARSEFALGVVAALVTVVIATTVGAISAFYGGLLDTAFMRLADLIIMTPFVTILIVLSALFDVKLIELAFVVGITSGFGGAAIIIKSQALTIKVRTYIEAARVAGGSNSHIILRHIIPNLLPLSFLYMMFTVTTAIFSEAVLSFFGLLNIRMSWGLMIHTTEYTGYLLDLGKWWLIFPASLSITMLCAAFYLVGRALDEIVNPRLRRR
ncbi:MAG TPA: ABC transporter permease [Anaerolineales bacterium]|jgi:peptide/nickel transport system permease protein|nr:ABC transporter permease [Anaerolineales bacterium]